MNWHRSASAPPWCDGETQTPMLSECFAAKLGARARPVPPSITPTLRAAGLIIAEPNALSALLLRAALSWIARVPNLASIVEATVLEIHFLEAEAGYDISHSEPRWRTRIFVSIPDCDGAVGALRLAESIVHEAMHLHLTNLEERTPLVANLNDRVASPWRIELRPYQGVLHGLFVFCSIAFFFEALTENEALTSSGLCHVAKRTAQITDELSSIDLDELCEGLTEPGAELARRCLANATADSFVNARRCDSSVRASRKGA